MEWGFSLLIVIASSIFGGLICDYIQKIRREQQQYRAAFQAKLIEEQHKQIKDLIEKLSLLNEDDWSDF